MAVIKHVGVLQFAKLYAVMLAIVGLFYGILLAVIGTEITRLIPSGSSSTLSPFLLVLGPLAIVIFPILLGIGGFIIGAIGAFIYNVVASKVGGIELDIS